MIDEAKCQITIEVSEDTIEQIKLLAEQQGVAMLGMTSKLLADDAEAQAGLSRGPFLRKYMYR